MSTLISVIVPVYNTDSYLEKCIESIASQTYTDLQIILIDDGSTDSSPEICDKYAKRDNRIKVIHKQNGGLVSARKKGVKAADGQLVGWVDSDDWIESDYFEQMADAYLKSGADLIAANHFHDIGGNSSVIKNNICAGVYDIRELYDSMIYSGIFFEYGIQPHVYTKLFNRDLLRKLYENFDNRIVAGEDVAIVYPYLMICRKICITDICGYHYVQHPGSIVTNEYSGEIQRIRILIDHLEKQFSECDDYQQIKPQIEQYKKYMLLFRDIEALEKCGIKPYGDIPLNSKLVIYGAGVLGQKVYKYFTNKKNNIVGWADQYFSHYCSKGRNVMAPEMILKLDFDCVIIAVITEKTANAIKKYLMNMGIPEGKIRWLSEEVVSEKYVIDF